MSVIPEDADIVPDIIPQLNFTVPGLSFIWDQSQQQQLCYDNNLFVRCHCNYPDRYPNVETMTQYLLNGLVYPIESLYQTSHGSSSYSALCETLLIAASQSPVNCSLANDAMNFCPRFSSIFIEAFTSCDLVSNDGAISSVAEGEIMINEVINVSSGIAIPAEYISANCELLYFGIAPLREVTVQNGGASFESTEEEIAYHFYTNLTSDLTDIAGQIIVFDSDAAISSYVRQNNYGRDGGTTRTLGGAIVFNSVESPNQWDYTMRFNHTREQSGTNPNFENAGYYEMNTPFTTNQITLLLRSQTDTAQGPDGRLMFPGTEQYYVSGMLSLQQYVDTFILNFTDSTAELNNGVANFPTAEYEADGFWSSVGVVFGVVFTMIMLLPVGDIIKQLVMDKELQLKEGMMQMGLYPTVYWSAWICNFVIYFFALSVILALVGTLQIFQHSTAFYVFLFFLLFFTATIMMCIFISAFFSKARTASTMGMLAFLASFFVYFAVDGNSPTSSLKAACVLPAACLGIGTIPLSTFEDAGIGITSDTLFSTSGENISFGECIIMLTIDTALYGVLAWCVTQVIPSDWGTHRSWYFCCDPRFLFRCCFGNKVKDSDDPKNLQYTAEVEGSGDEPGTAWIEKVPTNLLRQVASGTCLSIRNLKKVYHTNGSSVYAVGGEDGPGFSITMFRGQITALLGHNGAGKSTAMHMLSGMTEVTYGDAYMSGKSVRTNMQEIRDDLGVCPQHDILYDDMTCLEHLKLFAVIKGVPHKYIDEEVESMITAVGLTEKRNERSKTLSGGQKRKLSVGMAFIGGSTTIILDEPTSGMDPHSRRFTWDVIRRMKPGRIVILTTHFMDEADLLGDRIAIMSHGRLECCGSSLFLKRVYGVGYSMTLVKEDNHDTDKHGEEVMELMNTYVPEVAVLSDVGKEISLQLPQTASSQFPTLLTQLDENLESLRIASYGVSVTTLEEVFLRVEEGTALRSDRKELKNLKAKTSLRNLGGPEDMTNAVSLSKEPEFNTHIKALIIKRMISFKRERKMQCFALFAPMLFVLFGLLVLLILTPTDQPSILLDPNTAYNTKVNPETARNPFYYNDECSDVAATCGIDEAVDGLTSQSIGPSLPVVGSSMLEGLNNELFSDLGHAPTPLYGSFAWDAVDFANANFQPVAATNITGIHAAPIFLNSLTTSWLRGLTSDDGSQVTATVHPLPLTTHEKNLNDSFTALFAFIFIAIAFSFIPAAWVGFIVREREQRSKHLQVVSGVSLNAYWLSTYAWDILSFLPTCILTVVLMLAFRLSSLTSDGAIFAFFIVLILWAFACTGFAYVLSFFFESHGTAMTLTLLIHIILGFILPFVTYFFLFFTSTQNAGKVLKWVLRIFPSYAMGDAVLNLATREVLSYVAGSDQVGVWSLNVSTADMIYLIGFTFVYGALVYVLERKLQGTHTIFSYFSEWKLRRKLRNIDTPSALWDSDLTGSSGRPPVVEDDDIIAERQRIQNSEGSDPNHVIELHGLRKAYPISDGGLKIAVRDMWLRVSKGDCFGFLGTNGAGKTTAISMIVGEQQPTLGVTKLDGTDVVKYPEVVHRLVGYTPQFDALLGTLTGREHLYLYGRIKGIKPNDVLTNAIEMVIKQVGLTEYADRVAGSYSGGNKRKLSVGIALLGSPPVIVLDEPSTGVDPVARHFMWNIISDIVTERKEAALILTTHLMEECEALSNRIGIMVGGRLRCLGSAQHLKEKFGMGFQLEMTLSTESSKRELEKTSAISNSEGANDSISKFDELNTVIGNNAPELLPASSQPGGPSSMIASVGTISYMDLAAWMIQEEEFNNTLYLLKLIFKRIELKERQGQRLRFDIPRTPDLSLAKLFSILEENKEELRIQEYMLGQTTLENVFNTFAATQDEEKAPAPGTVQLIVR